MIPIPNGWSTMTSIDKTMHRNLRRVFTSGVSAELLARYEPTILASLGVYFAQLTKSTDEQGCSLSGDMRKWNFYLGLDTMADFGRGIKTGLLASPARDYVFRALQIHEKKMGLWEQMPVLNDLGVGNLVSWLFPLLSPDANQFARWYKRFLDQAIANNTAEPRGIFGPVVQSGQGQLESPGHDYANMIGEGAFSTFSAADAYGIMLSDFFHYVASYPRVYKTLATEMRSMFQPGERIVWSRELESNVYLRAVIDEVLRLLPPACGVHWRECECEGVAVGKARVAMPVGGDVGISLFALFRDGRIFRDPVRFWPERWVPGTLPEAEQRLARKMFTPFSIGPRNCAGSHVAIMMASIAYAHVLVNYDFRLGVERPKTSPRVWSNAPAEMGADVEMMFESHYSIAGRENGPFVQFKERALPRNAHGKGV